VGGRAAAFLAGLACVLTLAACGGDGDSTAGDTGPATLKVGVIPIADVAPLYLGVKKGFFEREKLTIRPQLAEGGAQIVTSVVSGDYEIGFSNTTSLIIAASKGLPVQILAQGVLGGASTKDAWDALLVPKRSPIRTAQDLRGKTVGVNNLNNVGPLAINTALDKRGVDYKAVKYVEVPFPEMNAALDAGRIDAGFVVEPFVTQGTAAGARAILHPYEETEQELTIATYFATRSYVEKHRGVVDRFKRAIDRSLEYAAAHPDEVRDVVLDYTKIPAKGAQAMVLATWRADLNRPTIERTADLALRYGFVKERPNLDDVISP
jgi:NitT/TauT family transport system substrate-binding protein